MNVVIDDPEMDVQVARLAAAQGVPVEEVLREALNAGLERMLPVAQMPGAKRERPTAEEVLALIHSFPRGPVSYERSEDEILGYGPNGYCE